ncbi:disulfide bond formation protein B [Rickettsiales endosymbiont of Stachyamoeba lipophora]|uniref:disulfide bond formation protein B n=1 Tax=Rickettsiales endosymbiont of Stachyamoeba lipophora TaxID=2486578 RepID=UPI000F64539B|nr:disulfide bond formation protein B [Rickettsiales endosymbiont of Stachyamoeba lipophora]AZL15138.1 disulfide bond formation protein B [Rickettsiales endosymbiont of Stachyamoeba lipophora]
MTIKSLVKQILIRLDIIALASTIVAMGLVLIMQYGFNFLPCKLCVWQRYIFLSLIGIIIIKLLKKNNNMDYLIIIVLLLSSLLAGYQALLELGLVSDWFSCSIDLNTALDLDSILSNAPQVSCKQADKILGLTLSNISLLYSLGLMMLYIFKKYRGNY